MAVSNPISVPRRVKDLTGQMFGNWLVLAWAGRYNQSSLWLCRCHCGRFAVVGRESLKYGRSKGCNLCYHKRRHLQASVAHRAEYKVWYNMKNRCLNPKRVDYHRYGGRGIGICSRWINSFEAFLQDMGPRPSRSHSIDRIDNDRGYEKDNCRWATRKEQSCNRRSTRLITHNGQTLCLKDWAALSRISRATLRSRLAAGWSFADAISIRPPNGRFKGTRFYTHNGQTLSLMEWSKLCGIGWSTLNNRLKAGWTFADAISIPPDGRHDYR